MWQKGLTKGELQFPIRLVQRQLNTVCDNDIHAWMMDFVNIHIQYIVIAPILCEYVLDLIGYQLSKPLH